MFLVPSPAHHPLYTLIITLPNPETTKMLLPSPSPSQSIAHNAKKPYLDDWPAEMDSPSRFGPLSDPSGEDILNSFDVFNVRIIGSHTNAPSNPPILPEILVPPNPFGLADVSIDGTNNKDLSHLPGHFEIPVNHYTGEDFFINESDVAEPSSPLPNEGIDKMSLSWYDTNWAFSQDKTFYLPSPAASASSWSHSAPIGSNTQPTFTITPHHGHRQR